jgi:crossover junction endodeoxyribonuclease RuvC
MRYEDQVSRVLGLDPGLRVTGWGIIEAQNQKLSYIAHGTVQSSASDDLGERLRQLFRGLEQVIKTYKPSGAAVEETFVNKNASSTLKLGMARGIVLLVPALYNLRIGEYSANHIKKTVVGVGHAEKQQMITMVKYLLPKCGELSADAADALAVAICHVHHLQTQNRWGAVA